MLMWISMLLRHREFERTGDFNVGIVTFVSDWSEDVDVGADGCGYVNLMCKLIACKCWLTCFMWRHGNWQQANVS